MEPKPKSRIVYVVKLPSGQVWCRLLYRELADQVVERESGRGLTIHEEVENLEK